MDSTCCADALGLHGDPAPPPVIGMGTTVAEMATIRDRVLRHLGLPPADDVYDECVLCCLTVLGGMRLFAVFSQHAGARLHSDGMVQYGETGAKLWSWAAAERIAADRCDGAEAPTFWPADKMPDLAARCAI